MSSMHCTMEWGCFDIEETDLHFFYGCWRALVLLYPINKFGLNYKEMELMKNKFQLLFIMEEHGSHLFDLAKL